MPKVTFYFLIFYQKTKKIHKDKHTVLKHYLKIEYFQYYSEKLSREQKQTVNHPELHRNIVLITKGENKTINHKHG